MDYNQVFQERLKKLNPAQLEAVQTTEGPVMVIAGPGTGKTEILAARIANILSAPECDAQPHNILCLTFTNVGVVAMRKRLLQFIGPDAYKVPIHTYHSFCNEIIQQNLDYFGKRELELVSDLEKAQILEHIINQLPASHPLFKASGFYEVGRIDHLFGIMKQENWTEEIIDQACEIYLKDLPNREDYQYKRANKNKGIEKGDVKMAKLNDEKKKTNQLLSATKLFSQYQKALKEKGRYDYNDMITWIVKGFNENEELLAQYQEQFLYILVDEYQDTNGTQNEVLQLLTSFWDEPNVFIVGDDDQSIYRFQGANLRNIMDFYHQHKATVKSIVLSENYRSSQNILDGAECVITHNTERLTEEIPQLKKHLTARHTQLAKSQVQPQIIEYYNTSHEEVGIVQALTDLHDQGEDLSEIAIIFAQHRQSENIIALLEQKNLPYSIKEFTNILDLPIVQNLLKLLRYINDEFKKPYSGESFLFHCLHFDFFELNTRDITLLSLARTQSKSQQLTPLTLREICSNPKVLKEIHTQTPLTQKEKIEILGKNIEKWISAIPNSTLPHLIEKIYAESGLLTSVMNSPDRIWLMQVITTFFNFAKSETQKTPNITLDQWLKLIDQMEVHGIALPLNRVTYAKKGINLLSAHGSKGLEFKHVFLMGCTKKIWDQKGRSFGYKFPDTLTRSNDGSHIEEARRLFFVALTRAKEFLHISYPAKDHNEKEFEPSRFVVELQEGTSTQPQKVSCPDDEILEYHHQLLSPPPHTALQTAETQHLEELLKTYTMSATHLNKYLRCPVTFYYENILRIPAAMNEYMSFGNAIHYALEHLFKKAKKEASFAPKETLLEYFKKSMNHLKGSFTPEQFKKRNDYGQKVLTEYYDQYFSTWNTTVSLEYHIHNSSFGEIPLSGRFDKIEFLTPDTINVVDYKTGKFSNAREKLARPNDKNPDGGDYWRQMVFYRILLDGEKRNPWTMVSGEIDFVEKDERSDKFQKAQIPITAEDITLVQNQIKEVYQKIKAHQFAHGCNKEDCQWCNFESQKYKLEQLPSQKED